MGFLCSSETITYCFCYQVLKHFFWVNAGYLMVLLHFIGAVFIAFMLIFTPLEEGYWIRHIAKRIWPEWTLSSSNSSKHLFFFTLPCGNSFEQRFYCYFFFFNKFENPCRKMVKKKKVFATHLWGFYNWDVLEFRSPKLPAHLPLPEPDW